jgi:hypothetical protein
VPDETEESECLHPWQVHLTSQNQARIELQIASYQFPAITAHGQHAWDANWLTVSGIVTPADGKTWSFNDPCLTTWEAEKLRSWLRDVAAGTIPPSPLGTDPARTAPDVHRTESRLQPGSPGRGLPPDQSSLQPGSTTAMA